MSIANEPAFPFYGLSQRNGQHIEQIFNGGMTLRQYYAGQEKAPEDLSVRFAEALIGESCLHETGLYSPKEED